VPFIEGRITTVDKVVVASRRDARVFDNVKQAEVAVVEHGAGQRYHIDAGGPEVPHKNVTLFLAPSQRVADQSAHLFPNAQHVVVGSPRVEHLTTIPRSPDRIVLAWHWRSPVAPEAMTAWPHYQNVLPSLAGLPLLGHGHPAYLSKLRGWYKKHQVPIEPDWGECVRQAAVLVCDNSSVMWEACALDIPVVVLNAPWYRRDQHFGLRFWDYADIGPQVEHPNQLRPTIDQILENDQWRERRAEAATYVYDRIEGATAAAKQALSVWG
jgi:hypothetical protein